MVEFNKRIFVLVYTLSLIAFTINAVFLYKFINSKADVLTKMHVQGSMGHEINMNLNQSLFYFKQNNWMLNNRVFQYSSYVAIKNNRIVKVVGFILTKTVFKRNNELKGTFMCIIKFIKTSNENYYNASNVVDFVGRIKKIECDIIENIMEYENIVIAIVNRNEFKNNVDDFDDSDLENVTHKFLKSMISFQIPNKIFIRNQKLLEVATCVHYTHEVSITKVLRWLDIQQSIGIKRIIIYSSEIELLKKKIYEIYDQTFVEIRPYIIHLKNICDAQQYDNFEHLGKVKYQALKDRCENEYYINFDNSIKNSIWDHQVVTSNDCYLSFKFNYDIVAYYDFDEIIYPRSFRFDDSLSSTSCNTFCDSKNNRFKRADIYSFFMSLVHKKNISKAHVSSVEFTHALYIKFNQNFKIFMKKLNEIIKNNEIYFKQDKNLFNDENALRLALKLSPKNYHGFIIYPDDYNYLQSLSNSLVRITECFGKLARFQEDAQDHSFNRFIFFTKGKYLRKFIHFTDNVDAVYANFNEFTKDGTQLIVADVNEGVVSHFRNDFVEIKSENSSIKNLKIDLEYFFILISRSNKCL